MSVTVIASLLMALVIDYGSLGNFIEQAEIRGNSSSAWSYCIEAGNPEKIREVFTVGAEEFSLEYTEPTPFRTCLSGQVRERVEVQLTDDQKKVINQESDYPFWIIYS